MAKQGPPDKNSNFSLALTKCTTQKQVTNNYTTLGRRGLNSNLITHFLAQ